MAHIRKQLRDWLKGAMTGSPEAGDRVFVRRSFPLGKDLQPSFLVSVENERSADVSMGVTQERVLSVRIVAVAKGEQEADEDMLDAMCVFVEGIFSSDPTCGSLAQTYEYQSTEFSTGALGEKVVSTAALTFAVTVYTRRDAPQTAL